MSNWRIYIKQTGPGRRYYYEQRNVKVGEKWKTESHSLGPLDPRRKRSRFNQVAVGLVGVEDVFGNKVNSLYNRMVNKEPKQEKDEAAPQSEAAKEDAGENGDEGDSSE